MPKAISYQRFSATHQGNGSTLERQNELIDTWMANHPDILLSDISQVDKGKSAFKGEHLKGGLGHILDAISSGHISEGDYLLIERLDRLSRLVMSEMLPLLTKIINAGVVIVTLHDGAEYSKERINTDTSCMYILIGQIQSAHSYSEALSKRVSAANETKRENAKKGKPLKLGGQATYWLDKNGKLKPREADIVRELIDMYINNHGQRAFHAKYPELRNIHSGTFLRWFKNPALMGCWKTNSKNPNVINEMIDNVFEPLITKDLFYKLQSCIQRRSKTKPKESVKHNLAGLVICSNCGKNFNFRTKHYKGEKILYGNCSTYLKKGHLYCTMNTTWPYEMLQIIFDVTVKNFSHLIKPPSKAINGSRIEELSGKYKHNNSALKTIIDLIVDNPSSEDLKNKLKELEEIRLTLQEEIAQENSKIKSEETTQNERNKIRLEFKRLLDNPEELRIAMSRLGYCIEIDFKTANVSCEASPTLKFTYTHSGRSTKYKCYFLSEVQHSYSFPTLVNSPQDPPYEPFSFDDTTEASYRRYLVRRDWYDYADGDNSLDEIPSFTELCQLILDESTSTPP